MEIIKYNLKCFRRAPDEAGSMWEEYEGPSCAMPYSEDNLALARSESWDEPEIVDDGEPEPEAVPTVEDTLLDVVADQEYRLCMMELGGN